MFLYVIEQPTNFSLRW